MQLNPYLVFTALRGGVTFYEKDPAMKRAYHGQESGKGAVQPNGTATRTSARAAWRSRMCLRPSKIVIKLDFFRPFEAHNTASFTMEPKGEATDVTWAMDGPNLFVGKVMSIFIDMDKMIGKDFEEGLSNLKRLAER